MGVVLILTLAMILYGGSELKRFRSQLMKQTWRIFVKKKKLTEFWQQIFLLVHGALGICFAVLMYREDPFGQESRLERFITVCLVALVALILVLVSYYIIAMVFRGIQAMADRSVNCIMLYSVIVSAILLYRILHRNYQSVELMILVNILLYMMNLVSIGEIIAGILNKRIWLKSIWGIAIINIAFMILALTEVTFLIQWVFPKEVYSRPLTSLGDALYFVVISFFTVGYGDLYPTCETTKIILMIVIVTGFIFSAIFVSAALSTTMESFSNRKQKKEEK